jgi:hypothetical protein
MADKKKDSEESAKDAEISQVYRSDRKQRPPHLIEEDEQKQIALFRQKLIEAIQRGEGQLALDILKEMGYAAETPEYKRVIALLYPKKK